jgi:hypothetical protein
VRTHLHRGRARLRELIAMTTGMSTTGRKEAAL